MSSIQRDLIFDAGLHTGEDTAYYLKRGFRVVGIDANPQLIENARSKFKTQLRNRKLILLNYALSERDNQIVSFYLCNNPALSSLKRSMTVRGHWCNAGSVTVETRKLSTLIEEYGLPYYCKIDVEGYDEVCLKTLAELDYCPPWISTEAESSESLESSDTEALGTLHLLTKLGYRKFKLVDQATLTVLDPGVKFYMNTCGRLSFFKENWAKVHRGILRRYLLSRFGFGFPLGASGSFGDELSSEWLDYESAKATLLYHRRDYFKSTPKHLGLWCDWHATF